MRFLRPEIVWWLVAGLVALPVLRWRLRRRFAASTTVRWLGARTYRASFLRRLPLAALLAALGLTGIALMEPVLPYSDAEVQSRGLDIVLVLDLSSSMQERIESGPRSPVLPSRTISNRDAMTTASNTRLEATKSALKAFVRLRRDDRIALIVFSDNAYVVSPLTFDYDYLLRYIDLVDNRILQGEGMTAIGDGLALANYMLGRESRRAERRNQVVVLFTDGEHNSGRDPFDVLRESNEARIRVHLVGIDLKLESKKREQVQRLVQTIRGYGGRYFDAGTERDLDAASRAIDSLEKGLLVNKVHVRDVPVYHWFALPALWCLALTLGLRAIPYFIDQT